MEQYNQYKSNLVNFLSENLDQMGDVQLLKLLTNFRRQKKEHEDINMKDIIQIGIDLIETMIDNKIDIIELNKIRMDKSFQDWKRERGI